MEGEVMDVDEDKIARKGFKDMNKGDGHLRN